MHVQGFLDVSLLSPFRLGISPGATTFHERFHICFLAMETWQCPPSFYLSEKFNWLQQTAVAGGCALHVRY